MLVSPPAARHRVTFLLGLALVLGSLLPHVATAQSLRGSRTSVNRMYRYAQRHHRHFYETVGGVRRAARSGHFVRLTGNADYRLHDVSFPYVAPATRTFVTRLARQYRRSCGEQLVVTSAIRPESTQPRNASPRSVHPTGIAVDLRRPDGRCLTWLRGVLRSLEGRGVLEATEEHWPAHFHVAVFGARYQSYVARLTRGDTRVASTDRGR